MNNPELMGGIRLGQRILPNNRGNMRGRLWRVLLLVAVASAGGLAAQAPDPKATAPAVRVATRLVLVDVVVTDKQGRPVTDLRAEDFTLLEEGKAQTLSIFSLERQEPLAREDATLPSLPPNVYTNRPEYRAPPGVLTILLLDFLNTAQRDQIEAREQLLKYARSEIKPGRRMAVLALADQLVLLQDFTDDPQQLQAALEKATPEKSAELTRAEPLQVPPEVLDVLGVQQVQEMLDRIEALNLEGLAYATDARVKTTLEAMNSIARAMMGYPARKRLIWVSAAFPVAFVPDSLSSSPTEDYGYLYRSYKKQMDRTANLLAEAQIAVYPIDPRALPPQTISRVYAPGSQRAHASLQEVGEADSLEERATRRSQYLGESHMAMRQLADQTGGRPFLNRNDIDAAVKEATDDGSVYYALGYYPQDTKWDGKFRRIQVRTGRKDIQIKHRRGYYAVDAAQRAKEVDAGDLQAGLTSILPPTAVTFQVQVAPPEPAESAEVVADLLVDANTIYCETSADDHRRCSLDMVAAALNPDGSVAASAGQRLNYRFPPDIYAHLGSGGIPHRVTLQLAPGTYLLRLLIRDNLTGLMGRVDVPLTLKGSPE